jgi:hypothetical protein
MMKKTTLILLLALACIHPFNWHKRIFPKGFGYAAHAAPFLVCDPQPGQGVQWYVVTGLPSQVDGSHVAVDASGTYGFKLDLGLTPPGGPYTVKAKACKADTTWGEVCSADSLPFAFSRPSAFPAPANARLSQ